MLIKIDLAYHQLLERIQPVTQRSGRPAQRAIQTIIFLIVSAIGKSRIIDNKLFT
ncbi:hypothetical protein D3C71_1865330 [compost metagenome]